MSSPARRDQVLLDATNVRGILLAAAMTLLGDGCWYLPRMPASPASPDVDGNWATRSAVAAGRGDWCGVAIADPLLSPTGTA